MFLCRSLMLKTNKTWFSENAIFSIPLTFVPPLWALCWAGSSVVPWFLFAPQHFVHFAVTTCTKLYSQLVCVSVFPTRLRFTKPLISCSHILEATHNLRHNQDTHALEWSYSICPGLWKYENKMPCIEIHVFSSEMPMCLISKAVYDGHRASVTVFQIRQFELTVCKIRFLGCRMGYIWD